jgi:hypothetical protein
MYYIMQLFSLSRSATLMGLHDEILKALTKELLEKVAHFGAGDMKDLKKNSEELVKAFQKKISKTYFIILIRLGKVVQS